MGWDFGYCGHYWPNVSVLKIVSKKISIVRRRLGKQTPEETDSS
jgi:hypothetical protein